MSLDDDFDLLQRRLFQERGGQIMRKVVEQHHRPGGRGNLQEHANQEVC